MKQKIIIKVHMKCQKCRSKALKVASGENGVDHVGIEGSEKDQVVVIGEQVDSVSLTSSLRKKVGHAEIISIAEVKPSKPEEKKPEEPKKPQEPKKVENPVPIFHHIDQYPRFEKFVVIDEDARQANCCQM